MTLDPNEPRFPLPDGLRKTHSPCRKCGGTEGFYVMHGPNAVVFCNCGASALYCAGRSEIGLAPRSKRGNHPSFSSATRSRILERDRWTCQECGGRPPDVMLEVGHLVSNSEGKAMGMSDGELYADDNLYAVCQECNAGRSTRSVPGVMVLRLMRARRGQPSPENAK